MDHHCRGRDAGRGGESERECVFARAAAHGGHHHTGSRQLRRNVTDIDGAHVVRAERADAGGQLHGSDGDGNGDRDGMGQRRSGVMADALMAGPGIRAAGPDAQDRAASDGRCVGDDGDDLVCGRAERGAGTDHARTHGHHHRVGAEHVHRDTKRAYDIHRFLVAAEGMACGHDAGDELTIPQIGHQVAERQGKRAAIGHHVHEPSPWRMRGEGDGYRRQLAVQRAGNNRHTLDALRQIGMALLGCAASGPGSIVNFVATPGWRYYFQLGGQQGATGSLTVHVSAAIDGDADGIPDSTDNCPTVPNADQKNTDAAPLITAGAPKDVTIANSDGLGDACDPDIDNDGLSNIVEGSIGPGEANHALCPSASADTDPLKSDSDGDRVLDGAECALGSDPMNAASKPAIPSLALDPDRDGLSTAFELSIGSDPTKADTDGDGINDGIEYKGYNTSPTNTDTDGDGCPDGREISSVDANTIVNSVDLLLIALRMGRTDQPVQDVNKDGIINVLDLATAARNFNSTPCP